MRLALERLGVSQRAAASASGVTHAALNRALSGDSEPSAELVFKVAEAHGLSLEWLFREQGGMMAGAGAGDAAREIRLAALREAEEAIRRLAAAEAASGELPKAEANAILDDVNRLAGDLLSGAPKRGGAAKKRA